MKFNFLPFLLYILLLGLLPMNSFAQKESDQPLFKPTPSWVKSYPFPKLKSKYKKDWIRVQIEEQYNHITGEEYNRLFFYINTKKGTELGSFYENIQPDYERIDLNKFAIHRARKTIAMEKELHLKTTNSQTQIAHQQYHNQKELTIYFDQIQAGDLIEIAYTIIGKQPDLHNALFLGRTIMDNSLVGKEYLRVINDSPIYYTLLNTKIKPKVKKEKEQYIFELIGSSQKYLSGGISPNWYIQTPKINITDKSNWNELVNLSLKNHQLELPPSDMIQQKVKELIQNISQKEKQIEAILNFIQQEIKYLSYGLIEPKPPETTLGKGYGDCKSMSLLTIKMLECLAVEAYPILVHTRGIDDRLINSHSFIFNHEIIEFIYQGDTIPFDATINFQQGSIYQKYVHDFRYGLRVIKGNNQLSKLNYKKPHKIVYTHVVTPNLDTTANEIMYNFRNTVDFFGQAANESYNIYKEKSGQGVYNKYWDYDLGEKDCHNINNNSRNFEYTFNQDSITASFKYHFDDCIRTSSENDLLLKFYPFTLFNHLIMNISEEDILGYFPLPKFQKVEAYYKIALKDSVNFMPDTLIIDNDWLQYRKIIWADNDTVYADFSIELLKTYLKKTRFKEVEKVFEQILDQKEILIRKTTIKTVQPKNNIKELLINALLISTPIIILGLIIRFIRRRKRKIKALESEVERLNKIINKNNK